MMEPGFIIHALGELNEHIQIVRAQVELPGRGRKEKATVGPQFSFRIFPPVAADFAGGGLDAHRERAVRTAYKPDEYVAGAFRQRAVDWRGHADGAAELADCLFGRRANSDYASHGLKSRFVDCVDMDGDQNDSRQVLRYECEGLAALFGQEVMSFVEDDPVGAPGLGTEFLQF